LREAGRNIDQAALVIAPKILLAVDPLGPAASAAHQREHDESLVAQPVRLGRERPGDELIPAGVGSVREDRERRRTSPGRPVQRRFERDRPCAIRRPHNEVRDRHAFAGPRPFRRSVARGEACRVIADQRSGYDALPCESRRVEQPVRTVEPELRVAEPTDSQRIARGGQYAAGDLRLTARPFAIQIVERRVAMRENDVRPPVGLHALDHDYIPDALAEAPDPRAVKTRNLGRHVGRRHLDVELVRQRDDGLGIDRQGLCLRVVHRNQEQDRECNQNSRHVSPEAHAKSPPARDAAI
jgi:hypothetical protein